MDTISVAIGQRFASGTEVTTAGIMLDAIPDKNQREAVIDKLLEQGLYAVVAQVKAKKAFQTPAKLREWTGNRTEFQREILTFILSERKRGRSATYSQADRFTDHAEYVQFAQSMLLKGIALPYCDRELLRNKNAMSIATNATCIAMVRFWNQWRATVTDVGEVPAAPARLIRYLQDNGASAPTS